MQELVILRPGDEPALEDFLRGHTDSAMFLRANLRRAGLADRGEVYQGTYAAVVEAGAVRSVAAHYWNGVMVVQAPQRLEAVVRLAARKSGRAVGGLSGPLDQVEAAVEVLGLGARAAGREAAERLYALDLDALRVPEPLSLGLVRCRRPRDSELGLLAEWRAAYEIEALGIAEGPGHGRACADDVRRARAEGCDWLLEADGAPVAYSRFNAALPDIVQVGGVWTPPALRRRGYARAAVAGSLLDARAGGVARAVLFSANPRAERAYGALGFEVVGAYGLLLLPEA